MKRIQLILTFISALVLTTCADDDRDTDFINDAAAPTNISLLFEVTQDNSGLVSMTPSAEGATFFEIFFDANGEESATAEPGETVDHVYAEGTYTVRTVATAVNGKTTEAEQTLVVSFQPPQNVEVTIENDGTVSNTVKVNASAEFAISYEVDFGEGDEGSIVSANIEDEIVYEYEAAGFYTITVTVFSAAIENVQIVEEDFEVTEILAPLTPAPIPSEPSSGVIAIYSDTYEPIVTSEFPTVWSDSGFEEIQINGNNTIQYADLGFTGIVTDYANPTDLTGMDFVHFDYWTTDATTLGFKIVNTALDPPQEDIEEVGEVIQDEWVSVVIPLDDYDMDRSQVTQLLFDTLGNRATVFIDNLYFSGEPQGPPPIVGTWKLKSEAGSLGVGPAPGNTEWFACDAACVADRACYFDDLYVFGTDGTFSNVLQDETWIEGWQGGTDACGTPVAPYDGMGNYTYTFNEETGALTVNGEGAYIGLPKANNAGELPNVPVPSSITYSATLTDGGNGLDVLVEAGSGVFWQYKLEKVAGASPLEGSWKMAPEGGSLGVGPAPGDTQWFACDDACVADRACYFDDEFVFGADGTFRNILGAETWIEGWQGGSDSCGTPVAPYDGMSVGSFIYDEGLGQVTINGEGLYIGIPKANNAGELPNVAVPSSIVYDITLSEENTVMNVVIESGSGVFWQYKLIKN